MKKLTAALTILPTMFVYSVSQAQYTNDYDRKIHVGFKIGMNTSSFTKDVGPFDKNSRNYPFGSFSNNSKQYLLAAQIGLVADYRLNEQFSISTECIINGHGMQYNMKRDDVVLVDTAGKESSGTDIYTYVLYYAEMPIILRYNLPLDIKSGLCAVYAGIAPGYNIYSGSNYTYYNIAPNGDVGTTSKPIPLNNVRNYQVSTVLGLWAEEKESYFDLPFRFFFDLRYQFSHAPVFTAKSIRGENYDTNVWTFTFAFGIKF